MRDEFGKFLSWTAMTAMLHNDLECYAVCPVARLWDGIVSLYAVAKLTMQILHTQRTIIETISLNDAEFFVSLVNSPDWLRFIGDRQVNDAADARRYLQAGFLKCYSENGFGYYLVRTLDRTPIGICGFLKKAELENADFGFALHPDWFGLGLGYESATAVLDYGIRTYSFTVLDAVTSPDNVRSKRLLDRLGFIRIGAIGNIENTELYRWRSESCNGI